MKFVKLFETEKYGQIVVMAKYADEHGAEVVVTFANEDLGFCSLSLEFDGDDALDNALLVVEKANEQDVVRIVKGIMSDLNMSNFAEALDSDADE